MLPRSSLIFSSCLIALICKDATSLETNSEGTPVGRVRKRNAYPWSDTRFRKNTITVFDASRVWQPSAYTLSRPYYIPVLRPAGRSPIFYPPQPLYVNPGTPIDNPSFSVYRGPAYLPPKETPPATGGNTYLPPKEGSSGSETQVGNRFGDDDDDAPIWGGDSMAQIPLSGDQRRESSSQPTRPPMSFPPRPPLVHDSNSIQQSQDFIPSIVRTTTARPAPAPPAGPTNCVWAIISCCTAGNPSVVPQNCFEQRGCPGPFWGASPCEADYAQSAIEAAIKYYGSNQGK